MYNFEEIKNEVASKLSHEFNVSVTEVVKNNGLTLHAINILKKGDNISPSLYIDDFVNSSLPLPTIAETLINNYKECIKNTPHISKIGIDINKCYFAIVNAEKNEEYLKTVPHKRFLDLAIIYRVLVDVDDNGIQSFIITNHLFNMSEYNLEELHNAAFENTRKFFPMSLSSLESLMMRLLDLNDIKSMNICSNSQVDFTKESIIVLTNQHGVGGANLILYNDIFEELAKQVNSDIFILPSSVHELLLIKASDGFEFSELISMVREVNATELSIDEVLSNNIYKYDRQNKRIDLLTI